MLETIVSHLKLHTLLQWCKTLLLLETYMCSTFNNADFQNSCSGKLPPSFILLGKFMISKIYLLHHLRIISRLHIKWQCFKFL